MEVEARIEPGSLRKLIQNSKTWDASTRRDMRAGLRTAAMRGASVAQAEVLGPPPDNGAPTRPPTGLRRGLAAGVSVSIQTGRVAAKTGTVKGEGVRVITSSRRLPPSKTPMVKAYMAREFRHPVFGNRGTYVTQRGKDWFYKPLWRQRSEYQRVVVDAINKAIERMAD